MANHDEHWSAKLAALQACSEALVYAKTQPDLKTAWAECPRGDWMLWLLGRFDKSEPWTDARKPLLLCALDCADADNGAYSRSARNKDEIAKSVGILRAWASGDTMDLTYAQQAAKELCCIYAAAGTIAATAARAVATTASAATAARAARAASAAAAVTVFGTVARKSKLHECADIVRKYYPQPPEL